tara:strand:- start:4768 stop:5643 length:876 start_codon:yes stop_codon:yes gene_type:complete
MVARDMSTNTEEMYSKMVLTIPDLVIPQDIPNIINWFDYNGIADVEDVDVREHPEQEYYVEDTPFYGYAVININKWYKNNNSLCFYKDLIAGYAKIVYDDPYYWEVDFYEPRTQEEVNKVVEKQEETFHEATGENQEYYSEEEYWKSEVEEAKERMKSDEAKEETEEATVQMKSDEQKEETEEATMQMKSDEQKEETEEDYYEDDAKDEDYEFEESDEEQDFIYEYLTKKSDKMKTRSKCKENKSRKNNLNTENITLRELIVNKNKNYVKRDKKKPFKNVWSRRLRQKLDA